MANPLVSATKEADMISYARTRYLRKLSNGIGAMLRGWPAVTKGSPIVSFELIGKTRWAKLRSS
jgi:hypothetical protein